MLLLAGNGHEEVLKKRLVGDLETNAGAQFPVVMGWAYCSGTSNGAPSREIRHQPMIHHIWA